jgi:hypothetical protein
MEADMVMDESPQRQDVHWSAGHIPQFAASAKDSYGDGMHELLVGRQLEAEVLSVPVPADLLQRLEHGRRRWTLSWEHDIGLAAIVIIGDA